MTVVPMPKFGLEPMLQAIERFNVTTLLCVHVTAARAAAMFYLMRRIAWCRR
jgi:hypothetical protein